MLPEEDIDDHGDANGVEVMHDSCKQARQRTFAALRNPSLESLMGNIMQGRVFQEITNTVAAQSDHLSAAKAVSAAGGYMPNGGSLVDQLKHNRSTRTGVAVVSGDSESRRSGSTQKRANLNHEQSLRKDSLGNIRGELSYSVTSTDMSRQSLHSHQRPMQPKTYAADHDKKGFSGHQLLQ